MTPVEKFSITMSLMPISSRTRSRARSSFRLRVMLRLLGLSSSQEASRWERSGRVRDSSRLRGARGAGGGGAPEPGLPRPPPGPAPGGRGAHRAPAGDAGLVEERRAGRGPGAADPRHAHVRPDAQLRRGGPLVPRQGHGGGARGRPGGRRPGGLRRGVGAGGRRQRHLRLRRGRQRALRVDPQRRRGQRTTTSAWSCAARTGCSPSGAAPPGRRCSSTPPPSPSPPRRRRGRPSRRLPCQARLSPGDRQTGPGRCIRPTTSWRRPSWRR